MDTSHNGQGRLATQTSKSVHTCAEEAQACGLELGMTAATEAPGTMPGWLSPGDLFGHPRQEQVQGQLVSITVTHTVSIQRNYSLTISHVAMHYGPLDN